MKSSTDIPTIGTSRRNFLHKTGILTIAAALVQSEWVRGLLVPEARAVPGFNSATDTFNGLAAFIVPGPDPYSAQQGVTDPRPGAVAACTGSILAGSLDLLDVGPPPFPGFSAFVAFFLNHVAQTVHPTVSGPFDSHLANLAFADKALVFSVIESGFAGAELAPLGGILPALTAFIAYSEAGLLRPELCTLNGVPVGWAISGYNGLADGGDDFKGYFQGRRSTV